MTDRAQQKRALLASIDQLLDESLMLPKTRESWTRREKIDLEILLLCRRVGDLSSGPLPYWAEEESDEDPERTPYHNANTLTNHVS